MVTCQNYLKLASGNSCDKRKMENDWDTIVYLQFFQCETPSSTNPGVVAESWATNNRSKSISRSREDTTGLGHTLSMSPLLAGGLQQNNIKWLNISI